MNTNKKRKANTKKKVWKIKATKDSLTGAKEIDMNILLQLPDKDVINMCKLNTFFAQKVCTDYFWKLRFNKYFPKEKPFFLNDWKKSYIHAIDYYTIPYKIIHRPKNPNYKIFEEGIYDQILIAMESEKPFTKKNIKDTFETSNNEIIEENKTITDNETLQLRYKTIEENKIIVEYLDVYVNNMIKRGYIEKVK